MRDKLLSGVTCSVLVLGLATPICAQTLADIAKKEEERRKTVSQPAKVYTNKDLTPVPPSAAPPAAAPASGDAKDAAKDTKDKDAKDKDAKDKDSKDKDLAKDKEPAKDKAYWAGRLKALQDQVDRDKTYADALQSRINALTTDFVNRDDPAQRAVVERDRLKNIAELNRLKQAIQDGKKALADFTEEARRAGVPPGWLR
jgi:hypothetical protein